MMMTYGTMWVFHNWKKRRAITEGNGFDMWVRRIAITSEILVLRPEEQVNHEWISFEHWTRGKRNPYIKGNEEQDDEEETCP